MTRRHVQRRSTTTSFGPPSHDPGPPCAVGKRSLVDGIQLRSQAGAPVSEPTAVRAAAAHATSGLAGTLPHVDRIQQLFGHHDVRSVRAYVGGPAAEGAAAMGAQALATGDQVAFGASPDLHTAAHEAAHVVQQRGGVQLKGGVGEEGDRYERHADAVADRVGRGESAAAVLDEAAPSGAGGAAAVQRRVTSQTAEANLLTNDEDGAVNLEGLRQVARRTFALLSVPDRATVTQRAEQTHGKPPVVLLQGGRADVQALTATLRGLSPALVYPGAARTFAQPSSQTEHQRFNALVDWAVQTMAAIGSGGADAAITSVFGVGKLDEVRGRFAYVGGELGNLARAGDIYSDLTGAREEMNAGAVTSFGRYIQMNRSFLAGIDDGAPDAIGLMHEALHYYFQDITDHGGYADQVEAFKTRPVDVKFTNAAHYEEVIRRFTNRGPVGGDFIPEDDQDAPVRTPLQRAVGAAAGVLQTAWERGLNVHGFLVHCHDHPDPSQRPALLYFSSLLKLTLGGRAPRVADHLPLPVNDIDMVGAESATRMLSVMKQQLRPNLLVHEEQTDDVNAMRDLLLRKAARSVGPLTGSVQRDLQVIAGLAACPPDVSTVNLAPVQF